VITTHIDVHPNMDTLQINIPSGNFFLQHH